MKLHRHLLTISMATGLILSACASPNSDGGDGTGGATGTGGTATGGSPGTGGTGTGGTHATGGSLGTGGTGTGGITGTGGSTGGSVGTGGSATGGAGGSLGGNTGGGGHAMAGHSGGGSTGTGGTTTTGGGGAGNTYNPCPTDGTPCKILPVGDSITYGINYEGSYRPELFHDALMAGQNITFTGTLKDGPSTVDGVPFPQNFEATSGITIQGISQQITKNKTLSMPSDIVLIHIGTNDMYMSDPGGAPDRLGMLIDQIIAGYPNALIAVAQIIPLNMDKAQVTTYNAAIPGVVATRVAAGKHVIVVDLNTGFPAADMDSVHPYQDGYQWMGDKWYAAIGSLFPKKM